MTEACAVNSNRDENKCLLKDNAELSVKEEHEVIVKKELVECSLCLNRTTEHSDLSTAVTTAGTTLSNYLSKFTLVDISKTNGSKFVCKTCLNLVNILERAELEYFKLKEEFQSILSKNPLLVSQSIQVTVSLDRVKNESVEASAAKDLDEDSEDEPLALTKKKRHRRLDKRKQKTLSDSKRKVRSKNFHESWECAECEVRGQVGGAEALATHMLLTHTLSSSIQMEKVKKEESPDRSQTPDFNVMDDEFKVESVVFDNDDDDESSNFLPDELSNGKHSKRTKLYGRGKRKDNITGVKKKVKTIHECDQCNAKYTSLVRLQHHKQKHDSKPPYICEVCGAHYKHKRACDIHVAMHKGISDWKCEECNKLFPSKGALQRHNNIHTGKLNYQCDLCGKSFIHTSSFKMHKLSHSGVKPHACDVCGLALMTRSHLKRHKRVHSGEKRHECAVCGKRFSERYNLIAHAKAHGADAAPGAELAPRRRLFRCGFCPERFERRHQLERHAAAAHGRALERPPPTPRNTMSKLLKAQAQRRAPPADSDDKDADIKIHRSPETRTASASSQKHLPQIPSSEVISASSWAGVYAAEFGLRGDYSH